MHAPSPSSSPAVTLELEGMAYGDTHVLGPVSLMIRPAERVALTGPSGIGKTTLLRILAGLETRFCGERHAPARIAMVFQEPTLLPWRTALQNITLTTGLSKSGAEDALAEVGLAGLGARYPAALSLGQQRRLSLARAFASVPDLMLMDEPFVSLDEETARGIEALLATLQAGATFPTVTVTHDEAEARRLATRIVRLAGRPATIAADERI